MGDMVRRGRECLQGWLPAVGLPLACPQAPDSNLRPILIKPPSRLLHKNPSTKLCSPGTTLMVPAGTPASSAIWAKRSALSGVCSAGLSTMQLPVARAGATFQASISSGKFLLWGMGEAQGVWGVGRGVDAGQGG